MIPTNPSNINFELQWLEKIFLSPAKSEVISQNSLFELNLTESSWFFGIKTQKKKHPDHVLDSKMQSTNRMSVLIALFERYHPNKAFQDKFWAPVTSEKYFRAQQSQRGHLPKLSFWTDFDWIGLILGLKTQKTPLDHILGSKMQTTRRVGVLLTLFERYDPTKAFAKKIWVPVTWLIFWSS